MPSSPSWGFSERDHQFFERELQSFVPDRIYDAHMHLGRRSDYSPLHSDLVANTPEVMDMKTYRSDMSWLMPGRSLIGAMVIPTTLSGENLDAGDRFATEQAAKLTGSASSVAFDPKMSADQIAEAIRKYRPRALKCYHLMSPHRPTMNSTLDQYLPEHAVRVADEAGLPIIVHLVRPTALSDESNQTAIRALCRRYRRMKLILAHGARGFNPSHTIGGIDAIRGLDNVYFDVSCVTESATVEAIFKKFGPSKVMWGSDYPFSHLRGRCIAIDNSFVWLYDNNLELGALSPDRDLQFVLVGLEALRVLKYACMNCDLTDTDVEDIFCNNAVALFSGES